MRTRLRAKPASVIDGGFLTYEAAVAIPINAPCSHELIRLQYRLSGGGRNPVTLSNQFLMPLLDPGFHREDIVYCRFASAQQQLNDLIT